MVGFSFSKGTLGFEIHLYAACLFLKALGDSLTAFLKKRLKLAGSSKPNSKAISLELISVYINNRLASRIILSLMSWSGDRSLYFENILLNVLGDLKSKLA
jgi:hypothetical protein